MKNQKDRDFPLRRWHILALSFSLLVGLCLLALPSSSKTAPLGDIEHPLPEVDLDDLANLIPEDAWDKVTIESGDTLAGIFSAFNWSAQQVHAVVHAGKEAKRLQQLHPGRDLHLLCDSSCHHEDGQLLALKYPVTPTEILHIWQEEEGSGWHSQIEYPHIEFRQAFGEAVIDDSLFLAGKRAGLDDSIIMEMANLFGWDIDFIMDIRPGDSFKVLYEEPFIDGQKVANGSILAATFSNQGRHYSIFRYTDAQGHSDYYSPDGMSIRKAFIRTPVKFTRISSKFDLNRKHPVLHKIRAHKGVDYAAPTGTAVKATGDGKVVFAARDGGFGNVVKIQHGQQYKTVYAHLSRFAKGIKEGTSVTQGQIIGYVGSTGLATGPHLHYEFQVNGVHQNPLTVPLPKAKNIESGQQEDFKQQLATLEASLDAYQVHQTSRLAYSED